MLRSILFVPGVRPDRFGRALESGADAVVFDLEDSVEPDRKAEARDEVFRALSNVQTESGPTRLVRINAADSEWLDDDLKLVKALAAIEAIVVPKARDGESVAELSSAVQLPVFPLLETPAGILNAASIAGTAGNIAALLFGAEDLTAAIGVPRTLDGEEILFARSQVVLAAASVDVDAIDAVWIDLDAPDKLRRDATRARALGFAGKMAIHPDQVAIINEVFTPTPAELDHAQRIVDAFEAAQMAGDGVIRFENQMIDAPVVARAQRVLARAGQGRG
jgi:citrate lyase subunit beta/citryl-CoA lyase